jgi:peptidoglycan-associated lipoprotein
VLRKYPNLMVTIEGHADERGSLEYNQALGQRRAESAKTYLVNLGLSGAMFRTVSFGEERPIAQGSNESAWAQNRRDEFVVPNTEALLK